MTRLNCIRTKRPEETKRQKRRHRGAVPGQWAIRDTPDGLFQGLLGLHVQLNFSYFAEYGRFYFV